MERKPIVCFFLGVWLFAIIAPPAISLVLADEQIEISINVNEEEKQEEGKKDSQEEKIVPEPSLYFGLSSMELKKAFTPRHKLRIPLLHREIHLPPPEHIT